jgi:hypothetical protein
MNVIRNTNERSIVTIRPFLRPMQLATAALLLTSSLAHAAISGTASLLDLQLTLSGPDGVTGTYPGLLPTGSSDWYPNLGLGVTQAGTTDPQVFTTSLPDLESSSTSDLVHVGDRSDVAWVSAAAGPSGLSTTLQYSVPGAAPVVEGLDPTVFRAEAGLFNSAGLTGDLEADPVLGGFWLAANSTATVTGTVATKAAVDMSDAPGSEGTGVSVYVTGNVVLWQAPDGGSLGLSAQTNEANRQIFEASSELHYDPLTSTANDTSVEGSQTFSLSVSNSSASGQWVILMGDLMIDAFLTPVVVVDPSGGGSLIPEPDTWALMGLGLVGIAGVSARRRQRPASAS